MGNVLLFFLLSLILKGVFCDTEVVPVKTGDLVTLHTDSELQKDDTLYWRLQNKVIARLNKESNVTKIYEDELGGKIQGRLKLDNQTGDLTITNTMETDSGDYKVSNNNAVEKNFKVIVEPVHFTKTISVLVGDLVTLLTDIPDIKTYNTIQWIFEHQKSPIAEKKSGNVLEYGTDKRFKDELQLDPQTGHLTIKNIRTEHSGLYKVNFISSGYTLQKSCRVTVCGVLRGVLMKKTGESVTLHTDTNLQDYDVTHWSFKGAQLAEIYKAENQFSTYDGPDGKFRGRLKLDEQTGDLTVMSLKTTDTGNYDLKITSSRHSIHMKFTVAVNSPDLPSGAIVGIVVSIIIIIILVAGVILVKYTNHRISRLKKQMHTAKSKSVTEGNPVTLHTGLLKLQTDDVIMWLFGDVDNLIARIGGQDSVNPKLDIDQKFTGRLRLDPNSGSLTIKETTTEDSGRYKVKINNGGKHSSVTFIVSVAPMADEAPSDPFMNNSGNNV